MRFSQANQITAANAGKRLGFAGKSMELGLPNQITAANAGKRFGFAGKSRVGLSPRPGVAQFTSEVIRQVVF